MQRRRGHIREKRAPERASYIQGLDGLRAIAVLSVIGYHIFPHWLPGGFLGVDIFFVLSGFLISTLLIRELRANGKIALGNFWLRRARRLIPALVLLIIVVVPLALLTERDLLVGIGRQVLGALTFSTNWLEISHGSSYFDSTTPILFKNFWSLAIEEQFYLFWPLIFILLLAIFPDLKARICVVGIIALSSGVLMAVLSDRANITRVYYGTDTHLFGLTIGIILAFVWADRANKIFRQHTWMRYGQLFGWGAFGCILLTLYFLPDDSLIAYRGGIFVVSCLAAVVIAALIQPESFLARIFELHLLRWFGTRSYGLYLWHWPIIVLMTAAFPAAARSWGSLIRSLIAFVITLLVCEISYRFLEVPIRKNGFRAVLRQNIAGFMEYRGRKVAAAGIAILLGLTALGIVIAPEKSQTQIAIEKAEKRKGTGAGAKNHEIQDGKSVPQDGGKTAKMTPAELAKYATKITDPQQISPTLDLSEPKNDEISTIGDSMFSAAKTGLDWAMPGIEFLGNQIGNGKMRPPSLVPDIDQEKLAVWQCLLSARMLDCKMRNKWKKRSGCLARIGSFCW
ncbi:acyltransferase family protein [Arcanobacterium hippocoleae]|uniref:acyltransferase family protein n=1 Tax=Arcanobacterium hippocoleae TaxID=149017 RepID=UPI00333EF9AC